MEIKSKSRFPESAKDTDRQARWNGRFSMRKLGGSYQMAVGLGEVARWMASAREWEIKKKWRVREVGIKREREWERERERESEREISSCEMDTT